MQEGARQLFDWTVSLPWVALMAVVIGLVCYCVGRLQGYKACMRHMTRDDWDLS